MKKLLVILLAILMCTSLLAAAHAATISVARSKMSDELLAAFDAKDAGETVTAIVEMKDVDHDEVMATFAKMYPEEFATYIRAKFDNLEETEFADILLSKEFSQYSTGDIDGEVLQRAIELKREIYKDFYNHSNSETLTIRANVGFIQYASMYAPFSIMQVSKNSAISTASLSNVISMSLYSAPAQTGILQSLNEEPVFIYENIVSAIDLANSITRAD